MPQFMEVLMGRSSMVEIPESHVWLPESKYIGFIFHYIIIILYPIFLYVRFLSICSYRGHILGHSGHSVGSATLATISICSQSTVKANKSEQWFTIWWAKCGSLTLAGEIKHLWRFWSNPKGVLGARSCGEHPRMTANSSWSIGIWCNNRGDD